ncbi:SdrD B-like domain-containing protein [Dyadobacter sp. CY312]|uniref:SdrD B-like domain-containing protein n=1 Tax=Dyadobacter sp. CY312 TaxID=2907303 RepID=UPI001F38CE3C|nr:SdrD B-like domain-containing protein [Dyadobacter sp. CY312]MCE7044584.1 T9SS type A sorting domain-containing protein [Dyadobacter sp. CY312]
MKIFFTLLIVTYVFTQAKAQTYKNLLTENFGTGTNAISQNPAGNINPGTSDYTARLTAGLNDGEYSVAKTSGRPANDWQSGGDHTTGLEYMMVINANPAKTGEATGSYYLFSTSNLDIPGASYRLSFWAANLLLRRNAYAVVNGAYIGVAVRNTPDANGTKYNSGIDTWILPRTQNLADEVTLPWEQHSVSFTLPTSYNSSALYFNFFNSAPAGTSDRGNDLALDDIIIEMQAVSMAGRIFNDVNANGTQDSGESGVSGAGNSLFVYLTDNIGKIIARAPVDASGNYNFGLEVPYATGQIGLKATVSTSDLAIGATGPAAATYPGSYFAATENTNGALGAVDGLIDGQFTFTSTTTNISNLNVGLRLRPFIDIDPPVVNDDAVSGVTPGSVATVANILANDSDNGGTLLVSDIDLEFGTPSFSVPNEGTWTLYPDGTVTFAPQSGFTTDPTPIRYTVTDAVGNTSNYATITVDYATPSTISGSVLNDNNGQTDGLVNGTGVSGVTVTLYAADGTTVLATTTTDGTGAYSFPNIIPSNYVVKVTDPSGFSSVSSSDGSPADRSTNVSVSGTTDATGVSFGINQAPTAEPITNDLPTQPFSGDVIALDGTTSPILSGIDPEDQPGGGVLTGKMVQITSLPSNGQLLYQGNPIEFGADGLNPPSPTNPYTIPSLQASDLAVELTGTGYNSISFDYTYVDAVGLVSEPAPYTINWAQPLPVTLTSFTAKKGEGLTTILNWTTTAETNSEKFEIQHSTDAKVWNVIETTTAKGESSELTRYHYAHTTPLSGENLYRLKMVDRDGTFAYSKIESVSFIIASLYPNPATDKINISGVVSGEVSKVTLLGLDGKTVYTSNKLVEGVIDVKNLKTGTYILSITLKNGTSRHAKIVIVR